MVHLIFNSCYMVAYTLYKYCYVVSSQKLILLEEMSKIQYIQMQYINNLQALEFPRNNYL